MAGFRDSAPESLTSTTNRGSDFLTESTYRPETASDHLADSVYRPGTSSDQVNTSDSVDETKVPTRLKGSLKSRIINQLCDADDFSADILHIPHQPARLVLQLGPQDGQRHGDSQEYTRQSRKMKVSNLPPAAENEEYLDVFFESTKRQGGGPVKKVTLMKDKHFAIVEFEEHDAVRRVLDKVPITMHDHVVDVEAMVSLLDDGEDIASVQIKGLQGLADEIRGFDEDSYVSREAQTLEDTTVGHTHEMTDVSYTGSEAAKVWHFCAAQLESIVTNFDAVVKADPESEIPNTVTITAEKKFENKIRKRLREVKRIVLSLQEGFIDDTDISDDLLRSIFEFNAGSEHLLLIGDKRKRRILAVFDDTFKPKSAMDVVRALMHKPKAKTQVPSATHQSSRDCKKDCLVTVALEIGERYSWYGFSIGEDLYNDPTNVHTTIFSAPDCQIQMPTVALFDEKKRFHSVGYEAESKYNVMEGEDEKLRWHFFKRFTNFLKKTQVYSDTCIIDDKGRGLTAKIVIAAILRYMKDDFMEKIRKRFEIKSKDIHWVLTAPSYWSESAKIFMRESAIEAGMKDEQLTLVPQSEAAALYSDVPFIDVNPDNSMSRESDGKKMIVDLRGEMSSMAVLERQHDGSYKELSRQYSSTLCGLRVSDEYLKFLQKIFGQESVKYLKDTYPTEFSYLQQQLEAKFRDYDATAYPNVSFKFPSVFEECVFAKTGKQIKEVVNASCFKGRLAVIGDKFRCESGVVTTFFSAYCTELVDTIRQVLENPDLVDAPAIVLVGEFSRSPLIHDVVKDAFPSRQVIIPSSPEVAVLTGAVIYVHNLQNASRSVIPKYTYGIAGPIPVKNAPQKQSDSEILVFFPKGQAVKIGDIRYKPSYIVDSGSCSEFEWRLIASSRKFLSTIDDDCTFLATVKLSFPAADKPRRVDVYMIFGVSNITVIVRDLKTGNSKKESINVDTLGHMHNA